MRTALDQIQGNDVLSQRLQESLITVVRSVYPTYPDWIEHRERPRWRGIKGVIRPVYDVRLVKEWIHPDQREKHGITGDNLILYFRKTQTFNTCLGLRDLEEIQKKSIGFFRTHFAGKKVFAWAGVVSSRQPGQKPQFLVPFLHEYKNMVEIGWWWTSYVFGKDDPALRIL